MALSIYRLDNKLCEKDMESLRKKITEIIIPIPQQRKPESFTFATERVKIDKIMTAIKEYIADEILPLQ